jgi:hypothetical protein
MAVPNNTSLPCFDNLIGLRGVCDYAAPLSGLHLDDVGITEAMLNDIVTSDYTDGNDLFQKKLKFSLEQIAARFHATYHNKYKSYSVVENRRVGFYRDNLQWVTPTAGKLIGQRWQLDNETSFLEQLFSSISLHLDTSGTYDLLFYDLKQNKLLGSTPVTVVAGEIATIYPHAVFASARQKLDLLVCFDPNGARYNAGALSKGGSCVSCGDKSFTDTYVRVSSVEIASGDTKIAENLSFIEGAAGLSINYSLKCDHKSWICSASNAIALPALYLTGFECLDFAYKQAANERVNNVTWLNVDATRQAAVDLLARYEREISNTLKSINSPGDSRCFICRENVRFATSLP